MTKKIKAVFISESIRRDSHAPLKYFKDIDAIHLYLNAPYGDMKQEDLQGSRQVKIENLKDEIVKEKPDVIQGAEPFGSKLSLRLSYISLQAAKKTKARLVVPILENRPIAERFNLVQRSVLRAFCPGYFKFASAIIILNKGAERNVRAYAKSAKMVKDIVWGVWGVDTDLFKPVAKKIPYLMIYAGRWVEEKGLKYMLEGLKIASGKFPKIKLQLLGQGPFGKIMREYAKENNLTDNIEFVGMKKNADLPKYFAASELCIYPSITQKRWEEQVGTVNFQAMACGTPVVTTKSGAIPEYLRGGVGAFLVRERDGREIGEAIIKYFSDDKLKSRMQKEAREYIMRFDVKSEIAKAEELFKKLVNEK